MAAGWSFTFCDLVSGEEIATLPVYAATFEDCLCQVGAFSGIVPTVDADVRALDPWAATEPRRTALYIEHGGEVQWGGIVWGRARDQDTPGLKLTAATFDSFLEFLYLRDDWNGVGAQLGPLTTTASLLYAAQSYAGADVRLLPYYSGDGTGENRLDGFLYEATALRSLAEILDNFATDQGRVIEWRVDVTKEAGKYVRRLAVYDEPLIGPLVLTDEAFEQQRPPTVIPADLLELTYPGNLLTWTDTEDGSRSANATIGAASGDNDTKALHVATADQVGSDELAAGFPLQTVPLSGGTGLTVENLVPRTRALLLDRLAQGHEITNVTVVPHTPPLHTIRPGYRAGLRIVHPAFREWPKAVEYSGYRIQSKKVAIGYAGSADSVALGLIPPADRVPKSLGLVGQFREIQTRLKELETP